MKRLFILALTLTAMFITTSCEQEAKGALFNGAEGETGFSFAAPALHLEAMQEDDNTLLIPIYRSETSGDIINVSAKFVNPDSENSLDHYVDDDPNKIFRLATSRVFFVEGSDVGYAQVTYTSLEALGLTNKFQFVLTLSDNDFPGAVNEVTVTVNRKLTYEYLGVGTYFDEFLFYETYDVEIYKAKEADVYRVMNPFAEGLEAEGFAEIGWATKSSEYIQIDCKEDGLLHFEEFRNGMYFQGIYYVYGIHPDDRTENLEVDCSKFVSEWTGEKEMSIYPFYYIKNYGYFECKRTTITLP